MSYAIEDNIPIPPTTQTGGPRNTRTPLTGTLDALSPGQSTLLDSYRDCRAAEQFRSRRPEKKFTIRKVGGQGWRVWRVA